MKKPIASTTGEVVNQEGEPPFGQVADSDGEAADGLDDGSFWALLVRACYTIW